MKSFKLWTGLLTLFLSGIIIGAAGTWVIVEHRGLEHITGRGARLEKVIMRKLDRELDLNESQRQRIETIVCRALTDLIELRRSHLPEREQIIEQGVSSIKDELSSEQRKKFEVLYEKMKKRRANRNGPFEKSEGVASRRCD